MNYIDPERRDRPSASNIERYFNCEGAWLLEQQVPASERISSKDAERGTLLHEANETGDVSDLEAGDQDTIERVRNVESRIYNQWVEDFGIADAKIIREQRWWLGGEAFDSVSAKLDFVAISEKQHRVLILDLKSGRKEVTPSPSNKQLRTGAVILANNYIVYHARVGIVAPFLKAQPLADYDKAALKNAEDELYRLLNRIEEPDAPRKAGTWCGHCPAKHICPELKAQSESLISLRGQKWSLLSPEQKLDLWDKAEIVEDYCKQIKTLIKKDVSDDPNSIPGLTKSEPSNVRVPKSAIGFYTVLLEEFPKLSPADIQTLFDSACKLSLGKLEEFRREYAGGTKEESAAWLNKAFAKHLVTVKKQGSVRRVK